MSQPPSAAEPLSSREITFRRMEELFQRALGIPEPQVSRFLEREESDPSLRQEVAALVRAHHQAGAFLESPALAEPLAPPGTFVGRRLGAWRLERQIGEGGMSSVYLGVREVGDFEQQVAIKLADQGYGGKYFEERLAEERRFLARLDHPGIARLFDGGSTEEGIPYLVMELAAGQPIDEYCRERRLGLEARIDLFLAVLDAVDFAHRALIVHRDLKPAHVLVDESGKIKLLDFGIAKLLETAPAAASGDVTRIGLFAAFTPNYASPEQFRRETITTATDVYALGVVFYQLLTGKLPRHFPSLAASEVEAAFAAEVPAPSRLGLCAGPEERRRRLPRDLDAILYRALAADPARRYPTAAALADDLRRLRSHHPVLARRPTLAYKLRLAIGRHRVAFALGFLALFTLVFFLLNTRAQAILVAQERDRAVEQGIKAEAVAAFLREILAEADPQRNGGAVSLRDALDHSARRLRERPGNSLREQYLQAQTLGLIYRSVGAYPEARPLLEESLRLARSGADPVAVAKSLFELAWWEAEAGTREKAEKLHREALELRLRYLPRGHGDLILSLEGLAHLLSWNFETSETLALRRQALELRRLSQGETALGTLSSQARYAKSLTLLDRYAEACPLAAKTIELLPEEGPHRPIGVALMAAGSTLLACGETARAEATLTRAIEILDIRAENHLTKEFARNDLGVAFLFQDRFDEAAGIFETSLAYLSRKLGPDVMSVALMTSNLAEARRRQGRLTESEELYRRALDKFGRDQSAFGVAEARFGLGQTLLDQGLPAAALVELEAASAVWRKDLPPGNSVTLEAEGTIGRALIALGREEEGRRRLAAAEAAMIALLGADHPRTRRLQGQPLAPPKAPASL